MADLVHGDCEQVSAPSGGARFRCAKHPSDVDEFSSGIEVWVDHLGYYRLVVFIFRVGIRVRIGVPIKETVGCLGVSESDERACGAKDRKSVGEGQSEKMEWGSMSM